MNTASMQTYDLTLDKFLIHAAKWHPGAELVTAGEKSGMASDRISYAGLEQRCRAVSALLSRLGIRPGDRVATLAWNTRAHVEAWYGIMGMGAVCHTLNPRLTAEHLAAMVAQSDARIVIADADLVPLARRVAERAPSIGQILVINDLETEANLGGGRAGGVSLEKLLAEDAGLPVLWGDFPETALSGLCFTSGTTGAPKGVAYTHRSSYLHTLRALQADVMAITAQDAVLAVVPMFHANAWGLPFAAPAVGAKLVLPGRRSDGASLARLIAEEKVTLAVGVPTVWLGLMDHLDETGTRLPSLQRIIVGGAPMPPALMARIERGLGITVQTSWGMTELSPLGVIMPPNARIRPPEVSGRPAVGMDLLLTDAGGQPLPQQRGGEGHLRVRGPSVVGRYLGHERPAAGPDGWFPTGDLARIDEQGQLIITGRAKDLIKSGGEWINPAEIEAIISALPEVSLAAVIGQPDPKWGERPHLIVELRGEQEVDDNTLLAALEGKVANWWIPDSVIRLRSMPLAATGKIDKQKLRADFDVL
ncbi:MAG: AMP-dependent synthetase [Alphaproteobacteria bacterium HGW-Alphaproteobacteria-18]|nr:MAG: AMP-dependent synthetase [Alphaproteobacteria bacterium HGW-Alphaproteobacteria-18]